jgi:bifunctional UDP-N-acetylglucosamine pyrophosphorylase/glucosamine-1-phosphate N-acetyltransferase
MSLHAVVLAAGLGTRMRSALPKVLHPIAGRPMVCWIVGALQEVGAEVVVVVHHGEEQVRAALASSGCGFARQPVPRGTGDAVAAALGALPETGSVLVTAGDTPLLTVDSIRRLLAEQIGPATAAVFEATDPTGYGRLIPGVGVVEEPSCTPEQRRVRTVNSGLYVFDAGYLRDRLPRLQPRPPKGELWLTDLIDAGAHAVSGFDPGEFLGVNDRAALAEARTIMRRRINRAHALAGVDFADLDVDIEASVRCEPGAELGPGVVLRGSSRIAGSIGAHCVVSDSVVHAGATVHPGCILDGAEVHAGAVVGPMARLRPRTVVHADAHIGNFVEVKNTIVHAGAKANHLAYLGDAVLGAGANIGAGAITCNYDGVRKHRTSIGAGAFIGSNAALVAPVSIGDGAIVGAGSTVASDVPADAIAVARPPLKVIPERAERLRARYRAQRDR